MTLEELIENKKPNNLDKFADYVLNRMKRDINFTLLFKAGYLMAGYRTFIYNERLYTRKEAKQILIDECNKLINK